RPHSITANLNRSTNKFPTSARARCSAAFWYPVPSTGAHVMANPMLLPFLEWARRLRFPTLFKLTAAVFAISVLLPDPIPFIDEIALGLGTLVLANWKRRKDPLPPRTQVLPRRR